MSISILLLTLNEEANLPGCFASVSWSDDVVVLDSFSQDNTVAVAELYGARVYQRLFDSFASQRNYALDQIDFKHDWILHLDADEIVTAKLHEEMLKAIQSEQYDAYRIPSKMMFLGRWLRYAGLYPSYQVRLGRRGRFRFKQVGHGQREDLAPERVGTLTEPYLHYSFSKGLTDWFEKHNRYASAEACEAVRLIGEGRDVEWRGIVSRDRVYRRRALKEISYRLPFRPLLRFLYMYLVRRGFLDGYAGLTYCRLLSVYEFMIVLKMRELMKDSEDRPVIPGRPN
ncbi:MULTISPECIES: glycosyltransferase family 2 protein [unclassified Thiocapsa]|uniref:glycosyltransferase family 2 protein n=1 Tax=unclassified Thiocapsa TaxID=2641286 RepID=UPI0035B22E10